MLQIEGVSTVGELVSILKKEIIEEMKSQGMTNEAMKRIKKIEFLDSQKWFTVGDIKKHDLWDLKSREAILTIIKNLPKSEQRINQKGQKSYYEVSQKAARIQAEKRNSI